MKARQSRAFLFCKSMMELCSKSCSLQLHCQW